MYQYNKADKIFGFIYYTFSCEIWWSNSKQLTEKNRNYVEHLYWLQMCTLMKRANYVSII